MSVGIHHQRGLTLLELLLASAIFLIISVAAYAGWRQVQLVKTSTDEQSQRMDDLQRTFYYLADDFGQLVNRPVRDAFGSELHPQQLNDIGENRIEFTRSGWVNPAFEIVPPRSTLQRVAYRVEDNQLFRVYWYHLDRAEDQITKKRLLIGGVSELSFRFFDTSKQWKENWPPLSNTGDVFSMPLAVEVTITFDGVGEITRLFQVRGS